MSSFVYQLILHDYHKNTHLFIGATGPFGAPPAAIANAFTGVNIHCMLITLIIVANNFNADFIFLGLDCRDLITFVDMGLSVDEWQRRPFVHL